MQLFPPPKTVPFMTWCGKIWWAGQATDNNVIRRIRFACWITVATDTHSEYVVVTVFHCNNSNSNAPQCYVIRTLHVLFMDAVCVFFLCFCVKICRVLWWHRYSCESKIFTCINSWTFFKKFELNLHHGAAVLSQQLIVHLQSNRLL